MIGTAVAILLFLVIFSVINVGYTYFHNKALGYNITGNKKIGGGG